MPKRKGVDPRSYQWFKRDKKKAFLADLIRPVLEGECVACCMDDATEREYLLNAVVAALLGDE